MVPENSQRTPLIKLGAICGLSLLVLYGFVPYTYSHLKIGTGLVSVFQALWTMWRIFPDFEHGMLVPFISAFVVYTRRRRLAALPINGWWPGLIFVVLSLALFWAGRRVDNQYIGFFSFQILLASLVLWLLGWRWLRALAFPLAFLVFTWPMPFLDNIITFPLRMFMSTMSTAAINSLGIPVIQNGSGILSAPNASLHLAAGQMFSVDIANPCSGIRSLFALMMISALYANFTLASPWKRLLLFLSSVPLAIAGNLFRILLLTMGIITLGAPTAIGTLEHPTWFHEAAGFAVFLVALSGMLLVGQLLHSSSAQWHQKWRSVKTEVKNSTTTTPRESQSDIY